MWRRVIWNNLVPQYLRSKSDLFALLTLPRPRTVSVVLARTASPSVATIRSWTTHRSKENIQDSWMWPRAVWYWAVTTAMSAVWCILVAQTSNLEDWGNNLLRNWVRFYQTILRHSPERSTFPPPLEPPTKRAVHTNLRLYGIATMTCRTLAPGKRLQATLQTLLKWGLQTDRRIHRTGHN